MANDKDFLVNGPVVVGKDTKVTVGSITASAIDLSTGNYFDDTLAADTTYTISNAGSVQAFQLEVTGGAASTYDIANASYDSVSFSVAAQDTLPVGLFFKPDGTKMYVVGYAGDSVYEYDLSTAWDVSAASFLQSKSVAAQETTPYDIFFKPDGTKMYVVGAIGDDVNEYNLSTAWDISTASFLQLFSVAAQETTPIGLFFKPDGTKMYVLGFSGDDVNEYNLSTPWDVSTASFLQLFSVVAQDDSPTGLVFKPDGTKMYVLGNTVDNVHEYNLSTAWDVSTSSFLQSFNVAAQDTQPYGLFFKPDGTKMYVLGSTGDTVYQYSTSTLATITWPVSIEWAGGVAPAAPATGETDVYTFTTDDGGTTYIGVKSIDNAS